MIKTNLAQTVDATSDSGSAYDTNIKYLFADKQILSRILKYTIGEFRNMDIPDIMDCIGDDIEIGTRPVDAGLSSLGRVKGTATEDNVPGEGIIYYDIRFIVYHKETEDAIEEISFARKTVFGNKNNPYPVDLMKGIIISIRNREEHTLGEAMEKSQNTLIAMLEELLSGKSAEEKKRIMADEYGMMMTAVLEGRIQIMCNLSENIEAKGIKKGIKKERIAAIERMRKANVAREQILSYGYTEEEYAEVEKLITGKMRDE